MLSSESSYYIFVVKNTIILTDICTQMIWEINSGNVENITSQITPLIKYGFFSDKNKNTSENLSYKEQEINYIVFNPSNECNLSCWYCYVDRTENIPSEHLTSEEIFAQIEKLLENKKKNGLRAPIAFSLYFTGEISLNFQVFLDIKRKIDHLRDKYEFQISLLLPPTNLLEPTEQFVEYINGYGYISVSLDLTNLQQTDMISRNIKLFDEGVVKHLIIPIHSKTKDIFSIYQKYMRSFHKVSMRPVRITQNALFPWTKQSLNEFKLEIEKFIDDLLSLDEQQIANFLLSIGPSDYFAKYLDSILTREKKIIRCPAGRTAIALDHNLKQFPCSGLIGKHEFQKNYTHEKKGSWEEEKLSSVNSDKCSKCAIKYYCGGFCIDWEFRENKEHISNEMSSECSINFIYFENTAYFILELQKKHPSVLRNYIEKKQKKFRLNYNLNLDDFTKIFA
ncbi:MAG: radical SAM protein [Candidatus Heimdallarchaeaceae archaeon]